MVERLYTRRFLSSNSPFVNGLVKALGLDNQNLVELHLYIVQSQSVIVEATIEAPVPDSDDADAFYEITKRYRLVEIER